MRKTRLAAIILMLCLSAGFASAAKILGISGYVTGPGQGNADIEVFVYDAGTTNLDLSVSTGSNALGQYATAPGVSDSLSNVDILVVVNNTVGSLTSNGSTWMYNVAVPNAVEINISINTPLTPENPANGSGTNDTTPYFSWIGFFNASYTFDLVIDDDFGFGSPALTINGITGLNYTLNSSQALPDDTYYWRVEENIGGAPSRTSGTAWFVLDSTPPAITQYSPVNYTWQTSSPASVTVTTDEDSTCKYDTAANLSYATKSSTMAGTGTSHTDSIALGSQGSNTFYVQCRDTIGNTMSSDEIYVLRYDNAAPSPGSVLCEAGSPYLDSTTVDFTWSGFTDATSGISTYYYSFSNNQGTNQGTSDSASPGSLTGAGQGTNTVYVWARDSAGNYGNSASDSIIVDTLDPILSSWGMSPSNIDEATVSDAVFSVVVTDTTWNSSNPPTFRYQFDAEGWFGPFQMTDEGGNNYSYTITSAAVGGWNTHLNEILYYQVSATDMLSHITTETRNEEIDRFNAAPILQPFPNMVCYERQNCTINLTATDDDGDAITFTSTKNFTFIQLTSNSARGWWVPQNDDVGSNTVTFTASDGIENDSLSNTIQVVATNDAPVLSAIGDLYAYLHVPFTSYLFADDPDNHNDNIYDNNILIFDIAQNYRWFKIDPNSAFNISNQSYYGIINLTPLLSHRGMHNLTVYVTDGDLSDSENITFTVGYCGDVDAGGDPYCDSTYENCINCEEDCGPCSGSDGEYMAALIDHRNCLGKNFTVWTYELYDRATCPTKGLIIEGMEVCANLSGVKVEIFYLDSREWKKADEFVSDDNGEITLLLDTKGEYKLVASKRGYPNAYEYLEIEPCIEAREKDRTTEIKTNKTAAPGEERPREEKPPGSETPGEVIGDASAAGIVFYYVVLPTIMVLGIVLGYYYYDRNKNSVAWLLRARIWAVQQKKRLKREAGKAYRKLKAALGI